MQIFVYMLRCRDGSYYVGLTRTGLDQRIADHRSGRFPVTRMRAVPSNWFGVRISSS